MYEFYKACYCCCGGFRILVVFGLVRVGFGLVLFHCVSACIVALGSWFLY